MVVPIGVTVAADFETPIALFTKLASEDPAFLFESAESSAKSGRYSIIGIKPKSVITSRGSEIVIEETGKEAQVIERKQDVLAELEEILSQYNWTSLGFGEGLPFSGGAVGTLSFDAVSQFEPSVGESPENDLEFPEAVFMIADQVIIFDHHLRKVHYVVSAILGDENPQEIYEKAVLQLNQLLEEAKQPLPPYKPIWNAPVPEQDFKSNTTQAEYESVVLKCKEYIASGDVFQVVPSQRFETPYEGSAVELYRTLRFVNPSPYMFILQLPEFTLVGSSPEVHVRNMGKRIEIRPIAGTRWRGQSSEDDDRLAEDLLSDPKERAEHLMLVDLARNDVGRISKAGTVNVDDFMIVERYSHVMHIVSNVSGELAEGYSAFDVMRSTFPAGTVSGAPKIRAMQIINEVENTRRGTYSGAVGYFGFDGSSDSCITLRTCLLKNGKAYVQAGAGVVADSDPTYEYEETRNKAKGMLRAVELAKIVHKEANTCY